MATHSSILAWRIPWTGEPGGLQSMGLQRVRRNWMTNTHTYTRAIHTWYTMKKVPWETSGEDSSIGAGVLSTSLPTSHSHRVWGRKQWRDGITPALGPNILSRTSTSPSTRELKTYNRTQIKQQSSAIPRPQSTGFYGSWGCLVSTSCRFQLEDKICFSRRSVHK